MPGHAGDGGIEREKSLLLDGCDHLGSESTRARCFVDDHATPGTFYRLDDPFDVERHKRPKVKDGCRDFLLLERFGGRKAQLDGGAPGDQCHVGPVAHQL